MCGGWGGGGFLPKILIGILSQKKALFLSDFIVIFPRLNKINEVIIISHWKGTGIFPEIAHKNMIRFDFVCSLFPKAIFFYFLFFLYCSWYCAMWRP